MKNPAPEIRPFLHLSRVLDVAGSPRKKDFLIEFADCFVGHPAIADHGAWLKALHDREEVTSTGIGGGVALPHAQHPSISEFVIGLARVRDGLEFAAKDQQPVRLLVMLAAPHDNRALYLKVLAQVASRLHQTDVVNGIMNAQTHQDMMNIFAG